MKKEAQGFKYSERNEQVFVISFWYYQLTLQYITQMSKQRFANWFTEYLY